MILVAKEGRFMKGVEQGRNRMVKGVGRFSDEVQAVGDQRIGTRHPGIGDIGVG